MCQASGLKGVGGVGVPSSLYERTLRLSEEEGERFTLLDVAQRVARCVVAFYWMLLFYPISFFWFLLRYNMLWEGNLVGVLLTVWFYPVLPLGMLLLVVGKKVIGMDGGYVPANPNIFFTPPKSPLAALLWDYYKALSPPFAQFLLNRGDSTAIAHSWWDHETHKDFWRAHLERVGARVPRALGRWCELEAGRWGVQWSYELKTEDIVIKVKDESNGVGDAFLLQGDGPGMVSGKDSVEAFFRDNEYEGKEALVLEWIRPAEGQEVHSFDIVTLAKPDGEIELLTVIYWGDCSEATTTHTTRAGYCVDAAKEELTATCKWYAPGFSPMVPVRKQYAIGHKVPGIAKACQLSIGARRPCGSTHASLARAIVRTCAPPATHAHRECATPLSRRLLSRRARSQRRTSRR